MILWILNAINSHYLWTLSIHTFSYFKENSLEKSQHAPNFECKPEFDEFGIEYDNARTSKKRRGKLVIFRFNQNDIDQ